MTPLGCFWRGTTLELHKDQASGGDQGTVGGRHETG